MSYYGRGDYYRGDYYRGDPGPFSFIEKGLKAIGRAVVPGFAAAESVVRTFTQPKPKKPFEIIHQPGSIPGVTIGAPPGGLPQITFPPTPLPHFGPPMTMAQGGAANPCPSGFHLDKRTRSRCVRNRSMNVLNPRALARGLRRAEGFEKIARRTVTALHRGPAKFKRRGKKK